VCKDNPGASEEGKMMTDNTAEYAGFWRRFAAYTIDYVILGYFLNSFYWFMMNQLRLSMRDVPMDMDVEIFGNFIFSLFAFVVNWCYFSGMESSPLQATIGKFLVGIYVTDLDQQRIGFGKATGRFFAKIISGLILTVGYWLAGFTREKQALHDMIAGSLVLRK
jgi:uncharacterized RDD family membrane protein YckC